MGERKDKEEGTWEMRGRTPSMLGRYSSLAPVPGISESSPTQRNSVPAPLSLGTGTERPQTRGVPLFKALPTQRALDSLL